MITTDRNVFVGAHVTKAIKDALKEEARRSQVSMSLLMYLLIVEGLERRGYKQEEGCCERLPTDGDGRLWPCPPGDQ